MLSRTRCFTPISRGLCAMSAMLILVVAATCLGISPERGCCNAEAAVGSGADRGGSSEEETRVLEYSWGTPLTGVGFLLPGRELRLTTTLDIGDPISAFQRVYLRADRKIIRVDEPAKLVGHVRIVSPEAALQYVRLFTSPATVRTMSRADWIEVVPASSVGEAFVFGNKAWLSEMPRFLGREREFGILRDEEWHEEGLSGPTVLRTSSGFIVIRLMFRPREEGTWWTNIAHWVADTVSADGTMDRRVLGDVRLRQVELQLIPEL